MINFAEQKYANSQKPKAKSQYMHQLYPLKFKPIFKEKIWGGNKIHTVMGLDFAPLSNCGEAWVLSGYEKDVSIVANGFLKDNDLSELVEVYMDDLVGEKVYQKFGNQFPLLIKLIHSQDWLSIQVHPDDDMAVRRGLGSGKTEMWYIIDAEKGAQLISGFRKKINQKVYLKHLESKTLSEVLNFEEVKPGDVFFIPAGRVHSLGPGVLLAEIQQASDNTLRIYDWDRTDDQGRSRELHTELALEAIDFNLYDDYRTHYLAHLNETCELVNTPFFTTNLLEIDNKIRKDYSELDSFVILFCLEGDLEISDEFGYRTKLTKGEPLLIPAIFNIIDIHPLKSSKLLEIYIL